jgi:hypothetical protein
MVVREGERWEGWREEEKVEAAEGYLLLLVVVLPLAVLLLYRVHDTGDTRGNSPIELSPPVNERQPGLCWYPS